MKAEETELLYWTCPDCTGKQEIILVKGMELPPTLCCDDCGHESDPLTFAKIA